VEGPSHAHSHRHAPLDVVASTPAEMDREFEGPVDDDVELRRAVEIAAMGSSVVLVAVDGRRSTDVRLLCCLGVAGAKPFVGVVTVSIDQGGAMGWSAVHRIRPQHHPHVEATGAGQRATAHCKPGGLPFRHLSAGGACPRVHLVRPAAQSQVSVPCRLLPRRLLHVSFTPPPPVYSSHSARQHARSPSKSDPNWERGGSRPSA
jgi:hypothetical protein